MLLTAEYWNYRVTIGTRQLFLAFIWPNRILWSASEIWTWQKHLISAVEFGSFFDIIRGAAMKLPNDFILFFPWFGSEWLLALSEKKSLPWRDEDFRVLKNLKIRDESTKSWSTTGVPEMFPAVAASLGKVHSFSRGALRRWPLI